MHRFDFLTSRTFWVIALCVTALHGLVFWSLRDTVMFEYAAYMFKEVLPRTFFVSRQGTPETAGDNGLLLPGEVVYTVPSKVTATNRKAPVASDPRLLRTDSVAPSEFSPVLSPAVDEGDDGTGQAPR